MPIGLKCPCGKVLQVATEHAGGKARCPVCRRTLHVPGETVYKRKPPRRDPAPTPEVQPEQPAPAEESTGSDTTIEPQSTAPVAASDEDEAAVVETGPQADMTAEPQQYAPHQPRPLDQSIAQPQPHRLRPPPPLPLKAAPATAGKSRLPAALAGSIDEEPTVNNMRLVLLGGAAAVLLIATVVVMTGRNRDPFRTPSREDLVAGLVARADHEAVAGDPLAARWMYDFAARYAPKDDTIRAKLNALPGGTLSVGGEDKTAVQQAMATLSDDDITKWPEPSAETELTELRMLLNASITGNCRCTTLSAGGVTVYLFLDKPSATVDDVRREYGGPQTRERRDDYRVLTYARLRLVADSTGRIVTVLYRP